MSRRRTDLPIMLGKGLKKGILAFRNKKMGGFDLYVLWLLKNYPSGKRYDMDDIDSVNAVLHFCDRESVKQTISVLNWILRHWDEER